MFNNSKNLLEFDEVIYPSKPKISQKLDNKLEKLNYVNKNFYMTCPISRCSSTMAECCKVDFK